MSKIDLSMDVNDIIDEYDESIPTAEQEIGFGKDRGDDEFEATKTNEVDLELISNRRRERIA